MILSQQYPSVDKSPATWCQSKESPRRIAARTRLSSRTHSTRVRHSVCSLTPTKRGLQQRTHLTLTMIRRLSQQQENRPVMKMVIRELSHRHATALKAPLTSADIAPVSRTSSQTKNSQIGSSWTTQALIWSLMALQDLTDRRWASGREPHEISSKKKLNIAHRSICYQLRASTQGWSVVAISKLAHWCPSKTR